jgi:hypothetical protein
MSTNASVVTEALQQLEKMRQQKLSEQGYLVKKGHRTMTFKDLRNIVNVQRNKGSINKR